MWDPVETKKLVVDRPEYHTRQGHCFSDLNYVWLVGEKECIGQSCLLTRLSHGRCGVGGGGDSTEFLGSRGGCLSGGSLEKSRV